MSTQILRSSTKYFVQNCLLKRNRLPPLSRQIQTSYALNKIISFNLSDIGEGIREVVIKEWFVKPGDVVEQFDNICEVQSDKASVTITSRYDGKIVKLFHEVDQIALVGKPLVDFDVDDDEIEETSSSEDEEVEELEAISHPLRTKVLATPAVRRIAMEHKLDLQSVTPTGKGGRILKGDVLEHLQLIPKGTQVPHPTLVPKNPPAVEKKETFVPQKTTLPDQLVSKKEPLKGIALAMYKSMTESLKIPHFAYCDEVDMSRLVALRDELKQETLETHGIKLTFMPFMIKAASLALLKYPILNSSLDESDTSIVYKPYHNISIAIATPTGLVVPNIKNVEQKTLLEIAQDLKRLQEKGQKGQLAPEDFANGTFSLSNIGNVGGTYTRPVIVPNQVVIGAVGKTRALPRFGPNDEVIKAHIMEVSWSADHRIVDGVTMASFSNLWKKYLENPNHFLLAAK
ncbi:lipoamide acyltransferase component of branched-chain alpha-keto acid dehydrogenase complex, mitochondrial [Culicoides brevitarsis]|uniref:lipoamide acyltransferase component of branched-chain alpha-keto acid dehydrogenase complex, mitochondrial n=1 Tax=Culicoides brevitarsis TaxID=469753 RepID=UPI00307BAD35